MPREKTPSTNTPRKRAPRKTLAIQALVEPAVAQFVDPERRAAMIAEAAYFRAERRGFTPGGETGDWLEAEAEVDAKLLSGATVADVKERGAS